MDGPEGDCPQQRGQQSSGATEPGPPQQIGRRDGQRPDQRRRQPQGERRGAEQGQRQGDEVNVDRLTAVVGREEEGVPAAQHVQRVETIVRLVAVRAGRPFAQPVEAQPGS